MFKALLDKERDGDQLPREAEKRLADLKDKVVNGTPLNTDHPGMSHLTPG